MNLEEEILKEHSRRQTDRIVSWIGTDSRRFRMLMDVFLHGDNLLTQRTAWVVGVCGEKHPRLVQPHLNHMLKRIREPGVHVAAKRNVVRLLQFVEIPDELLGEVATVCFEYLASPKEPIAVRALAMTVLANIAQKEPDLKNELRLTIEQQLSNGGPAICSRARKILKMLEHDEDRIASS